MVSTSQAPQLRDGGFVVGSDGELGKIGQVYVENDSDQISWVTVKTGMFGHESFVPMGQAVIEGDAVRVPFDKATVKDAPHADDAGQPLSEQQENDLYSYYGVTSATSTTEAVARQASDQRPTRGTEGEGVMTRSEEQLHVGTEKVRTGVARLRKFVVTEQQSVTVPVTREEVRVVREPLQPGDPVDGATIGEAQIEVPLTEERVVVNKDVVGVEKVRLDTQAVTEQREVTEAVRKEQIETLDDTTGGRTADPAKK